MRRGHQPQAEPWEGGSEARSPGNPHLESFTAAELRLGFLHFSSNTELLFLLECSKISLLGELQGSLSAVGDSLSSPVEILLSLSIPSAKRFE